MADDKTVLNLTVVNHLKGKPNPIIMKDALDELKRRNEMLRTKYFEGDDFAEQEPTDDYDSRMAYEDFSAETNVRDLAIEYVAKLKTQEFDIKEGDFWRNALVKITEND